MFNILFNHSAETGLVLFFVCFAVIAIFAATRSRRDLEQWSRLPLGTPGSPDTTEQEAK